MKTYKQLISELRSHPELNPHKSLVDNLEPYLNDPDIFITYTQDLGSKKGGAGVKVGINPQSKYNTPLGVYTYPLKEAWERYGKGHQKGTTEGKLNVPFAGEQPNVVVIRRKGKHIDDIGVSYSSRDWDKDIAKLKDYFVNKWSKKAKINTDINGVDVKNIMLLSLNIVIGRDASFSNDHSIGGKFWNVTRNLSLIDNNSNVSIDIKKNAVNKYSYEVVNNLVGVKFYVDDFDEFDKLKSKYNKNDKTVLRGYATTIQQDTGNVKSITLWNQIFRMLGYESIADKSGRGIIHEAEPIQAVFFSSKGYSVVGAFDNVGKKKGNKYNDGKTFEGTWEGGTWKNGIFKNGTWEDGTWEGGTWKNGIFKYGTWVNGTWYDGTWEDGTWEDGTWNSGVWKMGDWYYGTWEGGTWKTGHWWDGTWKDGYWTRGGWHHGTWEDGKWEFGFWHGGTWKNGVWKDGFWKGGTWEGGVWEGGTWKEGTWKDGFWKGGTWEGGKDKDGNFHPAGDSPDKW